MDAETKRKLNRFIRMLCLMDDSSYLPQKRNGDNPKKNKKKLEKICGVLEEVRELPGLENEYPKIFKKNIEITVDGKKLYARGRDGNLIGELEAYLGKRVCVSYKGNEIKSTDYAVGKILGLEKELPREYDAFENILEIVK